MWIKSTGKINKENKRQINYQKLLYAITLGLIAAIFFSFFRGSMGMLTSGNIFRNPYEALQMLPIALTIGCSLFAIYFFSSEEKKINKLVCPQCEKIKENDGMLTCECGGHFEDIKTMKWVEDKKGTV